VLSVRPLSIEKDEEAKAVHLAWFHGRTRTFAGQPARQRLRLLKDRMRLSQEFITAGRMKMAIRWRSGRKVLAEVCRRSGV